MRITRGLLTPLPVNLPLFSSFPHFLIYRKSRGWARFGRFDEIGNTFGEKGCPLGDSSLEHQGPFQGTRKSDEFYHFSSQKSVTFPHFSVTFVSFEDYRVM